MSEERKNGRNVISGAGVSICDPKNKVVFELSKPLSGNDMSENSAEIKAVIEGLDAAVALGIKGMIFVFHYLNLYQYESHLVPYHRFNTVLPISPYSA